MALEETTTLESVELVGEFNIIQAKWVTVVKKDGVVIAKFHTDAVKSAWSTHVSNSGPTSS